MTSYGRWAGFVQLSSLVRASLSRVCVENKAIVNGTNLTMKPGQTEPFCGYILVGNDGKIKAVGKGNPTAARLRGLL